LLIAVADDENGRGRLSENWPKQARLDGVAIVGNHSFAFSTWVNDGLKKLTCWRGCLAIGPVAFFS
jgi:hypothetical protein